MTNRKIKTWRERIGAGPDFPLHVPTDVERAMEAEIAELRAQQTSAASIPGTIPGTIRPASYEAAPFRERRKVPESGTE